MNFMIISYLHIKLLKQSEDYVSSLTINRDAENQKFIIKIKITNIKT